jgi:hypothetical protein
LEKAARLTACSKVRLRGPITDSTVQPPVTSVRVTCICGGTWRPIQSTSRVTCAEPVMIRNFSVPNRAMVRSLS